MGSTRRQPKRTSTRSFSLQMKERTAHCRPGKRSAHLFLNRINHSTNGAEIIHHLIESAGHIHHMRMRDDMGQCPNHVHHCTERHADKGDKNGYPQMCLYCKTSSWCVWAVMESSQHGWSGLVADVLGKNPSTAATTDQKSIDPATRCERRDGVHDRHKKECTTKI